MINPPIDGMALNVDNVVLFAFLMCKYSKVLQ